MDIAELVESTGIFFGLASDILSFYVTITTGYLIAAYLVGRKLGRLQITIISFLYVGMASIASYAIFAWTARAVHFATMHASADPMSGVYPGKYASPALTIFLVIGILASLKFMWDIRHPKEE